MKQVAKRKLSKTNKLIIIMSSVLVIFLATYFIVAAVGKNKDENKPDDPIKLPDIIEGEDIYLKKPIAYPRLEESEILSILVSNKNGTFDMTRWPDDNGSFWMGYDDGKGVNQMIQYIPPIVDAEGDFNYESLYAKENNDGYGRVYLLSYLCSAIGTPYFSERIPLPTGKDDASRAERDALLKEFGLDPKNVQKVAFAYGDRSEDGKTVEKGKHTIKIGTRALSDSGYYFMVDDRPYIYYTGNNYFDYALMGFHSFVNGMLVAEGLPQDSTYEPYLTTDFKEWINELHKKEEDKVTGGAHVITKGETLVSLNKGADYTPPAGAPTDGYSYSGEETLTFDLELLRNHPDYERIKNTLVGKNVGIYYDKDNPAAQVSDKIILTLINELQDSKSKIIDFKDKTSVKYTYNITAIESLLDNNGEVVKKDTPVGDYKLIKISYYYSIDGVNRSGLLRHAILDLDSATVPEDVKTKIKASKIGDIEGGIKFDINYTKDNSLTSKETVIISDIVDIFTQKGERLNKVEKDSIVAFRYYEKINGVSGKKKTVNVNLATIEKGSKWERFSEVLVGKEKGENLNITVYEETYNFEVLRDFYTYRINEISYFVTSQLMVSFKFCNASNRDPYYGESFFENTLDNAYKLYGLNASACEKVVGFLGGLTDNTTHSQGLKGETVAIGLNHKNMEKYGLYAYRIYFELPRGLYDISEGTENDSEDVLSDFAWHSTLGFNLYISEKDPVEGFRYVGSDMYDLVAKVYGDGFDFLERSFADFWARENLVLMEAKNLEQLKLDFNMEDIYGKYNFNINVKKLYIGVKDGKTVTDTKYFEGSTAVDKFYVHASSEAGSMETELSKYLEKLGQDEISISALYNEVLGKGESLFVPGTVDTVGVSNFMEAFELLQLTRFQGIMTEEEKAQAYSNERIMRMQILVKGSSAFYYTYDFYRFDDRKVMVSIYKTDEDGNKKSTEVSDFYISTFAFKKLVGNFVGVLNAKELDNEIPFPDGKAGNK